MYEVSKRYESLWETYIFENSLFKLLVVWIIVCIYIKIYFEPENITDHMWLLILARAEKGEVISDNKASKVASHYLLELRMECELRGPDC